MRKKVVTMARKQRMRTVIAVDCIHCTDVEAEDDKVEVNPRDSHIEDTPVESLWRAPCPRCGNAIEKELTLPVRELLRDSGVRTLAEIMESETVVIRTGSDEGIWHAFAAAKVKKSA